MSDSPRRCPVCGRFDGEDNPLTTFHVTYTNGQDVDVCPHCLATAVRLKQEMLGERWWENPSFG